MIARRQNWDIALLDWALGWPGQRPRWGVSDCTSLIRDGLAVIYGRELWPSIPRPTSARDARNILSEHGPVEAAFVARGAQPVPADYAQTGDVWWDSAAHGRLGGGGIAVGPDLATGLDEQGAIMLVPIMAIDASAVQWWRFPWIIRCEGE
jgi:hypothetical protein